MSHAPALLLLDLPNWHERGAFLVFYLVIVVATAQLAQELASRRLRRRPVARAISRTFSWRAWGVGVAAAAVGRRPALLDDAVQAAAGAGHGRDRRRHRHARRVRDAGAQARRRRPNWRGSASVTGAVGLLDRVAPLCFAAPVFFHSVRWYFGAR